jgi:hypothetical protein
VGLQVWEVGHDMDWMKLASSGTVAYSCERGVGPWDSTEVNVLTRLRTKP